MVRSIFFAVVVAGAAARAGSLPQTQPGDRGQLFEDLDGDAQKERITVGADGVVRVVDAANRSWGELEAALPPAQLAPPVIAVARGGGQVFLRVSSPVTGKRGRSAEQVGIVEGQRLRAVWSGVTGPQGPDGEWSIGLRFGDFGVMRFQSVPGVERCDGDGVVHPELYDRAAGRFRAVAIAPPAGEPLAVAATLPEAARAPLGLFHFVATSSQRGDEGRADRLAAPREIEDGRSDTSWIEGMNGSGRGAFVTARAVAAGQTVTGLKLVAGGGNRLRRLAIAVGKRWFQVDLPAWEAGRVVYVPLPSVAGDCVTLAIAEADRRGAPDETAIAEAAIITATDGEGLAALVGKVRDGAPGADALARIAAAHPAALGAALPGTVGAARQRLIAALVESASPEAAAPVVAELLTAPGDERRRIVEALSRPTPLSQAAGPALEALAADAAAPSAARADAAEVLGRLGRSEALFALVRSPSLEDQPGVRAAALRAVGRGPFAQLLPIVADAVAQGGARHPEEAVALLGVLAGRARAAGKTDLVARAATALAAGAAAATDASFELRFETERAARAIAAAALLPVVTRGAADGDEVVRWAAVEAAASLDGGAGRALVTAAITDPDPRVRAAALAGLGALADHDLPRLAAAALDDRWPLVRRAAAEALAAGCPGESGARLARAATGDSATVARVALQSLARCDRPQAADLALRTVGNAAASVDVREEAAAVATALKVPGAAHAVAAALADLLESPATDERGGNLAASLARALGRIGDPTAEEPLLRAAVEPWPSLRSAALEALGTLCTPNSLVALGAAAKDPDPAVRSAASRARCGKK